MNAFNNEIDVFTNFGMTSPYAQGKLWGSNGYTIQCKWKKRRIIQITRWKEYTGINVFIATMSHLVKIKMISKNNLFNCIVFCKFLSSNIIFSKTDNNGNHILGEAEFYQELGI